MPITFPCFIDTYPRLKLQSVPLLVEQLKLNDRSLFDYWNNQRWETITPTSILPVEKGRPVVFRHRPSLVNELPLSACPGISDFLQPQSRLKRTAENTLISPLKKSQRESTQKSVHSQSLFKAAHSEEFVSFVDTPISEPTMSNSPSTLATDGNQQSSSSLVANCQAKLIPETYQAEKSLHKQSVFSWDQGWKEINQLLDGNAEVTEATAFPRVFGLKYVKSTVCNYKKLWARAPASIKAEFIGYGNTAKGTWRKFALAVKKGATPPPDIEDSSPRPSLALSPKTTTTKTLEPTVNASPLLNLGDLVHKSSLTPSLKMATTTAPEPIITPTGTASVISTPEGPEPTVLPSLILSIPTIQLPEPFPLHSPLQPEFDEPVNVIASKEVKVEPMMESNDIVMDENLYGPSDDPKTLCPFCDAKLPEFPSNKLVKIRASLENKTWPDPTPDNPLHRSAATFQAYISYCTRHVIETEHLPQAISGKWLLQPDFGNIFDRVCRDYISLSTIAESGINEFLVSAKEHYTNRQVGILSEFTSDRFLQSGAG